MIKLFIYTLSLVIIVLAFMILTIVSYEGLVLGGLGWKIFFPYMTVVSIILLMFHAHHFWRAVVEAMLRLELPDNHDDCPHVMHSRHSKDAHEMLEKHLEDNDLK
jgi:amino acid permease